MFTIFAWLGWKADEFYSWLNTKLPQLIGDE